VLGMIKWEQLGLEGNPEFGVELQPIDFTAFARACGAAGYWESALGARVEDLRDRLLGTAWDAELFATALVRHDGW
jgi:thiamine pyrophosphate-dependent acetolactate synthase large subunit-like protein